MCEFLSICFSVLFLILLQGSTYGAFNGGHTQSPAIITDYGKYANSNGIGNVTNFLAAKSNSRTQEVFRGKICIGTSGRMSVPSNRGHHYRNLKDRYTNCTYVEGNLELTWIQDKEMDLSFLQHIREVTGYVLISHVDVKRILLPSLQVIRGRNLFRLNVHDDEFSLMVTLSKMDNLELPALRDVLNGNVGIFNNYNLCHVKTINWDEIISGVNTKYVYVYNFTQPERECPPCDPTCESGCWGEGPKNCQKFSKINCSPQCHEGRCYGHEPRQCCHLSCAGGCTGPKKSDCLACKKFYDDGECKDECPSLVIYNPNTYLSERNPGGKYAYGATCVKTCPDHLLRDAGAGACVRQCPPDKEAKDGECVACNGPCQKKCQGPQQATIHSGNIDSFRNCTIIEGSIAILETSFNGFQEVHQNFTFGERYPPMDPSKLEVFSTLKEITGYLNVQATHPNFTNLSYFRNLEVIGGREKADYFSSLYIVKTSLKSLNLRSLKKVKSGAVTILESEHLCFADTINWKTIMNGKVDEQIVNNSPKEQCRKIGAVCSSQCSTNGCWGPEPSDCLSCAKFKLGERCIPSCNATVGIYEDSPGICKVCHEQCDKTCTGQGPGNCTKCKNVKDGPFCVEACPESKYQVNGECYPCHDNCIDGCTGPENTIGTNGCNSCVQAIVNENEHVERCLSKDAPSCPDGYYYETIGPKEMGALKALAGKSICRKCHPRCKKCTAYGFHMQVCQECMNYKRGEQCEDECPFDFYPDEEIHECLPCTDECRGCIGSTTSDCLTCRNYRIYPDGLDGDGNPNSTFSCVISCPEEFPHRIVPEELDPYCSIQALPPSLEDEQKNAIIVGAVVCFVIVAIFGTILGLYCVKAKTKENTIKMTMAMTGGLDDSEPLHPNLNVKPNLSKFRTVKEEELRKGGILGCGAFGTVYKGVWIPEGQNVKIPVAIKVLREGTGANTSKEFLEEAYIMASVEHHHLLKLLAVCLTSQLMLVTQLMPLGCLRDYVHNNRDKIGSKALLNWCTQIAKGMEYLESRRLVHRDLAARNVLVQTPTFVKITDFGLAKLLDLDEDEYKAEGGKMPIKWLALECIKDRVFTHKSDVWAFGVTVWELLTYGGRPYENIPAREVPELLMKGERLEQPPYCTLELYMIIIKCWMVDGEARPSFHELVEEFAKMSRDPGRYLVIPGDKLMRLPSYTQQDERELIRNLSSSMDGPDTLEIIDAEQYFQPNGSNGSSSTNGGTMTKRNTYLMQDSTWPESEHTFGTTASSNRFRMSHDRRLYGGAMMRSRPNGQHMGPGSHTSHNSHGPNGSESRYCSDPLKLLSRSGDMLSDGSYSMAESMKHHQNNLRLPVDDDDYLMPSPMNNSNGCTYLDLVGDSTKSAQQGDTTDSRQPNGGRYVKNHHFPTLVDNPEYLNNPLNMGREYTNVPLAFAPIGLPLATATASAAGNGAPSLALSSGSSAGSSGSTSGAGNPHGNQNGNNSPTSPTNNNAQPFLLGLRPQSHRNSSRSEEESDHEYYNELDKLKREMQPLHQVRKNETTV